MSVSPSLVIDMMWSLIMDWIEEGSSKGSGDMGVSGVRSASSAPSTGSGQGLGLGAGPRASCRESSSWVTSLGDSGSSWVTAGGDSASRRCVVVVGLGSRVGV